MKNLHERHPRIYNIHQILYSPDIRGTEMPVHCAGYDVQLLMGIPSIPDQNLH